MNRLITIAIFAAILQAPTALAQTLTDAEVASAIRAGEENRFNGIAAGCRAGPSVGQEMGAVVAGGIQAISRFTVAASGAAGHIAGLAMNAKRLYQPLTVANLDPALREQKVMVVVVPDNPSQSGRTISVAASVQHVVLRARSNEQIVVQPVEVVTEAVSWSNLLGGTVEANRATAYFATAAMREMPPGDIEVIVITSAGERRCRIGRKDRELVFGR